MSNFTEGLRSSKTPEWYTPPRLVRQIEEFFAVKFALDVCATAESAKCERFFSETDDGLTQVWEGECWMNPPYGRQIGAWMNKALWAAQSGESVTCLVPARTDTKWWHDTVTEAADVVFLKGRVKFETTDGAAASAPFPSAVVRFTDEVHPQRIHWGLDR